jgi:U4/U6.U5 tri-snRNP-associated protein 2
MKRFLIKYGRTDLVQMALEKDELIQSTQDFVLHQLPDMIADKFDLVANITHENPADVGREGLVDPLQEGSYKCHVQHRGTQQWYEIQDLHVTEVMPQQIGISESYVLIFERKSSAQQYHHPFPREKKKKKY